MIIKQGIFKFGTGDISMTPISRTDGRGVLVFKNQEEGEIGREKSTEDFKKKEDDSVMFFTDTRSIDVLIRQLTVLKRMMQGDLDGCTEFDMSYWEKVE